MDQQAPEDKLNIFVPQTDGSSPPATHLKNFSIHLPGRMASANLSMSTPPYHWKHIVGVLQCELGSGCVSVCQAWSAVLSTTCRAGGCDSNRGRPIGHSKFVPASRRVSLTTQQDSVPLQHSGFAKQHLPSSIPTAEPPESIFTQKVPVFPHHSRSSDQCLPSLDSPTQRGSTGCATPIPSLLLNHRSWERPAS